MTVLVVTKLSSSHTVVASTPLDPAGDKEGKGQGILKVNKCCNHVNEKSNQAREALRYGMMLTTCCRTCWHDFAFSIDEPAGWETWG